MSLISAGNVLKKYEGSEKHLCIPEGIEKIDAYAFSGAEGLETIDLPSTLKEINHDAFYACTGLQEIVIPASVSYIGSGLFARCTNLRRIIFEGSLEILPKITFFQCFSLQEVTFPKKLKRIGRACFEQCRALTKIILPETVSVLEDNVFDGCVSLKEFQFSEALETIGENAFFECRSLEKLVLPPLLKEIGKGAFETRGKLSLIGRDDLFLQSRMFDNNWNMNWNFGANGRYNGKNEENYQLFDSYLPNISLREWKPEARVILALNYLETWRRPAAFYDAWLQENKEEVVKKIMLEKRYRALHNGLKNNVFSFSMVRPYLSLVHDPEERAKLLEMKRREETELSDLLDLF